MSMLEFAQSYASRGWRVLPLHSIASGVCTCGKECTAAGKHPKTRNGFHDSTADSAQIESWFSDDACNIGIATGVQSGIFVIDVDFDKDGDESLKKLEEAHGTLPLTVESITGKGRHIFFQCHENEIGNSVSNLGKGIDVRANGGYVVAPPSRHRSGRSYAWNVDHHPDDVKIAEAPAWLLEMLKATSPQNKPRVDFRSLVFQQHEEGNRNCTIASLSGHLLRKKVDSYIVLELLSSWNLTHMKPPLPFKEVVTIVESIARKELSRRKGASYGI